MTGASTARGLADASGISLELRAGRAVAGGALLAGPLAKRSEWLHTWNRRFCVLTTEELSWAREGTSVEPAGCESRAVRMHSGVRIVARDGVLLLQPSRDASNALWFSAASEAELRVWHRTLRALIDSLDSSARVARTHVHENASHFSAASFVELPHAGGRNLREGRLAKPFFRCGTEPQGNMGAATARLPRPPAKVDGSVLGGRAGRSAVDGDAILYLLTLPSSTAAWPGELRGAFRELMELIAEAGCPRLLPTLHVDVLPDVAKACVYRRYVPLGSLRDHIHHVTDPTLPHGLKYGRPLLDVASSASVVEQQASASSPAAAAVSRSLSSAGILSSPRKTAGGGHAGSSKPGLSAAGGPPVRRGPAPLPAHLISKFGREVLEGLIALKSLGLPCPHLHAGNVFLELHGTGQLPTCRISEYELALLGASTGAGQLARPTNTAASEELVCFGHILYEMVTGVELTKPALDALATRPSSAAPPGPTPAWAMIRDIFVPLPAAKVYPDTARSQHTHLCLEDLLSDSFFARDPSAAAGTSGVSVPPTSSHQFSPLALSALATSLDKHQRSLLHAARAFYPTSAATSPKQPTSVNFAASAAAEPSVTAVPAVAASTAAMKHSVGMMETAMVTSDAGPLAPTTEQQQMEAVQTHADAALVKRSKGVTAAPPISKPNATALASAAAASLAEPAGTVGLGEDAGAGAPPPAALLAPSLAAQRPSPSESQPFSASLPAASPPACEAADRSSPGSCGFGRVAIVKGVPSTPATMAAGESGGSAENSLPFAASSATVRGVAGDRTGGPHPSQLNEDPLSLRSSNEQALAPSNGTSASTTDAFASGPAEHQVVAAREAAVLSLTAAETAQLEFAIAKLPNKNRPSDYRWLEALLSLIALDSAPVVRDLVSGAVGTPMFVMAGACPSVMAGMQAVVFTAMYPKGSPYASRLTALADANEPSLGGGGDANDDPSLSSGGDASMVPSVDFWWLKPHSDNSAVLQSETLHRHGKGSYKNDPGASKKVYNPIASLFSSGQTSADGKLKFGVLPRHSANGRARAYIDCLSSKERYVVCWVWLEDWSSPVSFGKKFMKGKIIYQHGNSSGTGTGTGFFARPFRFVDSGLIVPAGPQLEEPVEAVLASDRIKIGCTA